jgi:hypothetical protein
MDIARQVVSGVRPPLPPPVPATSDDATHHLLPLQQQPLPPAYEQLIRDCWSASPTVRPTAVQILQRLQRMEREALLQQEQQRQEEEADAEAAAGDEEDEEELHLMRMQHQHDALLNLSLTEADLASLTRSERAAFYHAQLLRQGGARQQRSTDDCHDAATAAQRRRAADLASFARPAGSLALMEQEQERADFLMLHSADPSHDHLADAGDELFPLPPRPRNARRQQQQQRRGGANDDGDEDDEDALAAADEAEEYWTRVRKEAEAGSTSISAGPSSLLRPSAPLQPSAISSAATLVPTHAGTRGRQRRQKSRKLLAKIAQLIDEAEEGSGGSGDEDGHSRTATAAAASGGSVSVANDIAAVVRPLLPAHSPSAGLAVAAPMPSPSAHVSVPPRNVTPLLPKQAAMHLVGLSTAASGASALASLPISAPLSPTDATEPASTNSRANDKSATPLSMLAAPNTASSVVSAAVTPARAENLLLQHQPSRRHQRTPSVVLFHAGAPSAHATPISASAATSSSDDASSSAILSTPQQEHNNNNLLSPARVLASPSSTSLASFSGDNHTHSPSQLQGSSSEVDVATPTSNSASSLPPQAQHKQIPVSSPLAERVLAPRISASSVSSSLPPLRVSAPVKLSARPAMPGVSAAPIPAKHDRAIEEEEEEQAQEECKHNDVPAVAGPASIPLPALDVAPAQAQAAAEQSKQQHACCTIM